MALLGMTRKGLLDSATDSIVGRGPEARSHSRATAQPERPNRTGCCWAMDECAQASSHHGVDQWHLSSNPLRDAMHRASSILPGPAGNKAQIGIEGAFFAPFLCTSKERGSPAGARSGRGRMGED